MASHLRTLHDLALSKDSSDRPVVFLRLDLNVPMKNKTITDDNRIRAALPTIKYLLERNAKIIACSHLGRPTGSGFEEEFSLAPVGEKLAELLDLDVLVCPDYLEDGFGWIVNNLAPSQMILLENLRFEKAEQKGDENFAKKLSHHAQYYVNDAFGTCHRNDASIVAVAENFPPEKRAAGLLVEKEIQFLEESFRQSKAPVTAIFGGSKVSDKISVLHKFTNIANNMIIGGAMSYTFLEFMGKSTGKSKVERDKFKLCEEIMQAAEKRNVKIYLPEDHVCAYEFSETAAPVSISSQDIPNQLMGLDIGTRTQEIFTKVILNSKLVLWNGPMGVFEWPSFRKGTASIAKALAECEGTTIVGGGDSAAAIALCGYADKVSHVSTGGGASLELLEGRVLPGIQVLRKK